MPLAYFFDQHVPAAITRELRLRGIDVTTAYEDASDRLNDEDLLLRAAELKKVLFTQDEDLLEIAHRYQAEGRSFSGIVYAHQLRISIGRCVRDLELIAKATLPQDMVDRVEFLPL